MIRNVTAALACGVCIVALAAPAQAQTRAFRIPAGNLKSALDAYARQSGRQVIYKVDDIRRARSPGVSGTLSPDAALDALLVGSGFAARTDSSGAVAIVAAGQSPHVANAGPSSEEDIGRAGDIVVTGSRIRGAPPASPLIVVTRQDMDNAGQHDLGEVVRSIPQNFAGGQNPGAGTRTGVGSGDTNGGSSTLNLRGIGSDATLTLLNGHRLSTNGNGGVDISAIPLGAVDRLEILTDGASALYGSDAVGGVANVITKKGYDGLSASALYGAATDGGYEQQQFSVGGGSTWTGGGIIAGVTYARNSAITAGQRSYTSTMSPETSLYPAQNRLNAFGSVSHALASSVTFAVDALYSRNISKTTAAFTTGSLIDSGSRGRSETATFVIVPSLKLNLPGGWLVNSYATYGKDTSRSAGQSYSGGLATTLSVLCYCNTSTSAEAGAEGPLFHLPAGDVRVAFGGGYRSSRTELNQTVNGAASTSFAETDSVYYGFGEMSVPLVSPRQNIPFLYSLRVNGAVRYEKYNAFGAVATPKFGLIYGITPSLTLKGSWGTSFKAPQFAQRYQSNTVFLSAATGYGTLFPAGSTFIQINGGNKALKPERATSTTITGEFSPTSSPELKISVSYYHIDFRDRVIFPITATAGVLTNPLYASFVTANPSVAQQTAAIAFSPTGLTVLGTAGAYNAAKVVGIVDRRAANATAQTIDGIDFNIRYLLHLSADDSLALSTTATLLTIKQKLLPTSPLLALTGNFYQPRNFRSRSGVSWGHGNLAFSGFVNFSGGAKYRNITPIVDIDPNTTVDLTARWTTLRPLSATFAIAVANAFNAKPTIVPGGQPYESKFDTTAYAVTGRTVTLQITKAF